MTAKYCDWIPGTFGLKHPAVLVTADALIYQVLEGGRIQILIGTRKSPSRWEAGLRILTFGGFVDPNDGSIYETVKREVMREELRDIALAIDFERPFFTGPCKVRHQWHSYQRSISSGEQVQDVPVVTANFLARYVGGELRDSDEVTAPHWVYLEGDFAFDHALVLEHFLPRIVFQA